VSLLSQVCYCRPASDKTYCGKPRLTEATRAIVPPMAIHNDVLRLEGFRRMLRELDMVSFAALLRELAVEIYNRDIRRYSVLIDITDEIIDQATLAARARITDRWILAGRGPRGDRLLKRGPLVRVQDAEDGRTLPARRRQRRGK